ncbi:MAG: Nucleotidyltransferase domain protein [Methanoregulaceae archaeon PtaB.Bin056]|jgi:hypothetical protein|nr:MAG: Nucleotidyltransferase domain protein [Methanoregulaceae archaeon PtaB.Bin056]
MIFLKENRREILKIASRYGAMDIRLFGSVAKRSATETSDIDFLVTLEPGRTLFDLGGLAYELEQLLGRHVDVATRPILRKEVRERVENEAIPL